MNITVRYRIAQNEWNLKGRPWTDAVGIEEVVLNEDGFELCAVPPLVCWLTRGESHQELARKIVELLNADAEWLKSCCDDF